MLGTVVSALALAFTVQSATPPHETTAQRDKRMEWWREARFGMFIHWGLYSVPAGEWKGNHYNGAAEWLMNTAQIPVADYEPLQQQFNPVNFDATKWVRIAKDAGMKYIVITSKHHEGFGMWPSKQGTYNIGHTQFKRDPLKELAQACKREGVKLCFYHSIMDWHHPDYLPRQSYDKRPTEGADYERYVKYMKSQLKELLTEYGPIGILWFDGQWEKTWTHERGKDLYAYVRSLQPNIIINNRVDGARSGTAATRDDPNMGDYGTPEQEIPANGVPGMDWESCMTMNDTWGFNQFDEHWKSSETLVRNLVDCASKGGNYLLNVGPTSLGEIPQPSIERLKAVGNWIRMNGVAVYGTQAGPFTRPLPWGRVTRRGSKLYLCVFDKDRKQVDLPGLETKVKSAYTLVGHEARAVAKTDVGYSIEFKPTADEPVSVIVLETGGPLAVNPVPLRQASDGTLELNAVDATLHGHQQVEGGDKQAIGYWTDARDTVDWSFVLAKPGPYKVSLEYACDAGSAGSTYEVSVGGKRLTGTVESTGSWTAFQKVDLGTVDLTAGKSVLTVKPTSMPNGAVMNLRAVRLLPAS